MHERFLVHLQLCFVVSFMLRVPGLEEGVISSGKPWGWTTGTLIWMPGARRANVPSRTKVEACRTKIFCPTCLNLRCN